MKTRGNTFGRIVLTGILACASLFGVGEASAKDYVVKKGETYSSIAQQYFGVSTSDLINANKTDPKKLKVGQKIHVPEAGESKVRTEKKVENIYVVKEGDSFWKIGGNDYQRWVDVNPNVDPKVLRPGQKLRVPDVNSGLEKKITSSGDSSKKESREVRHISQKGLNMLKRLEGFSPTPYPDAGGYSIGYGHFIKEGESYNKITTEQGEALLRRDVARAEKAIEKHINVPLNQHQYDALVCLSYNTGTGILKNSTLAKKLNARSYDAAADEFQKWVLSAGKRNECLVKRRDQEKKVFSKGYNN